MIQQDLNAPLKEFVFKLGISRPGNYHFDATPNDLHLHPDVYEWLWRPKEIDLPPFSRKIFYGCAALQNQTGRIFALGFGTMYILTIPTFGDDEFHNGRSGIRPLGRKRFIDLSDCLGEGWIFGRFLPLEKQWFLAESQTS